MVSWLEEKNKNKEEEAWVPYEVEGAQPFFIPGDSISFYISLFFYDKFPKDVESRLFPEDGLKTNKIILDFVLFKFDDLTKGENIFTKIKTRTNEELKKKSDDLTFVTDFVKIEINYLILHPPDIGDRMLEAFYDDRERYRK